MALPFPDDHFDAVTVSFGLRNMKDYLGRDHRDDPGHRAGRPFHLPGADPLPVPVLGRLFNWYFTRVVPKIGGWLSGDAEAYRYLPTSVASFPDAKALSQLMREAGLAAVEYELLGLGTVAIHVGIKPVVRREGTGRSGGAPYPPWVSNDRRVMGRYGQPSPHVVEGRLSARDPDHADRPGDGTSPAHRQPRYRTGDRL